MNSIKLETINRTFNDTNIHDFARNITEGMTLSQNEMLQCQFTELGLNTEGMDVWVNDEVAAVLVAMSAIPELSDNEKKTILNAIELSVWKWSEVEETKWAVFGVELLKTFNRAASEPIETFWLFTTQSRAGNASFKVHQLVRSMINPFKVELVAALIAKGVNNGRLDRDAYASACFDCDGHTTEPLNCKEISQSKFKELEELGLDSTEYKVSDLPAKHEDAEVYEFLDLA